MTADIPALGFGSPQRRRNFEASISKQIKDLLEKSTSSEEAEDSIFGLLSKRLPDARIEIVFELVGDRRVIVNSASLKNELVVDLDDEQ